MFSLPDMETVMISRKSNDRDQAKETKISGFCWTVAKRLAHDMVVEM
jgi:hypothetical protein